MISGVPNMAYVFGYFRHSWTLRVDLVNDVVIRLMENLELEDATAVVPTLRPRGRRHADPAVVEPENFNSGYVVRSLHRLFRQGDRDPWTHMFEHARGARSPADGRSRRRTSSTAEADGSPTHEGGRRALRPRLHPAELTDSRPETVGAPRRNVGGAQGPRTRRSVPAETSCSRPPLTSDPWLQSETNAQQRRGSASETAGSSAPPVLSAPLNLRGGRLDVPDPGQRWTAKVDRDEASWAVDGYLPMTNAMATLRGFPIVLVATNHEDASLPNVEGQAVRSRRSRECQRHSRADRQIGRWTHGVS